ncbi:MAG TPA: tyrosine-type recombinase/integrase [Chthoniobacterales bacterium]|jgi:integrase
MGFLVKDALGRSPYWIAVYKGADGRQRRKSTKAREKHVAREILRGLEAAEFLGATQSATEEQFRHLIREVASRTTGRPLVDPTIRDHLSNWLESEKGTVEVSTLKRYRQVARDFETFLGQRGHARLEALSKTHFLEYRAFLQKAGHSPQNVNQTFKILCRPFKIAADERLMVHNPIGAIKRLRSVKAEKGIFSPLQISLLLKAAPDEEWRALIALGYFTGGRLLDLARLTWGSVDRAKQTLGFKQKKTGGAVLIPIHPELWRYLKKLPPGVGQAPLLRRLSRKSGAGKSGLSMSFRRVMEAAKIDPGIARARVGEAGRSVSKLSFHSLRHSFTSELARAGVAPEVRQQLTGHSDLPSHRTYTHLEFDTFSRAIASLPALP